MELRWESMERDPRQDVWQSWHGAVLLDDEIKYYSTCHEQPLISPFDEANLKPARYQLTLGPEAKVGGRTVRIDENNPLVLDPHQVAIVRTFETLNLPRFLIGRWNLTVETVYKGLLWVGALQVDPGWVGYLPCPLYNLSNDTVTIGYRERLFSIDFVRTTRFDTEKNISYPNKSPAPPLNPSIGYYDQRHIRSGPYEALQDLGQIHDFRNFAITLFAVMFTALAAIVAALGVIVIDPVATSNGDLLGGWALTSLAIGGIALVLSVSAIVLQFLMWRKSRRR